MTATATIAAQTMLVQTVQLVNNAGAPAAYVQRVERAVTHQVNHEVRRAWGTPRIRFVNSSGAADMTVYLDRFPAFVTECVSSEDGCHWGAPTTGMAVQWTPGSQWSVILSHELIESLIDPTGMRYNTTGLLMEACDPVQGDTYGVGDLTLSGNITLSDFVYPSYFVPGAHGPFDYEHVIKRPLSAGP